MDKKEIKGLIIQILISTFVIILLATIITLCDSCYPGIINIHELDNKNLILRTIIQTIGLFLGFIITAIVMKFNHLDGLIQKIAEDLNSFLHNNYFRNHILIQSRLNEIFHAYLKTHPLDEEEKKQILANFNKLYSYRNYHKQWFLYPLYYSLVTLLFALILLIFEKTLGLHKSLYVFMFSLCSFMSIWVIYINISFVLDFIENPFKRS